MLSDEELTALMKTCAGKDFRDRRDEAMIRLLLDCGLRVSELCALTVEGIDLDQGMAHRARQGQQGPPDLLRRPHHPRPRPLPARPQPRNAGRTSTPCSSPSAAPLSPDGARERMKVRGAQAGIEDLHPHRFRHTWAHDFLMSGGQERDLKRLAGWSSDVMLERYGASAADARAKAAAQRMKRGDRV